jgi:hypothetical protein
MSEPKRVARVEIVVFGEKREPGTYELRLTYTPDEDERTHWVDWELFEVASIEAHPNPGRVLYQRRGATCSPDHVDTLDEAERAAHGMLKWDGCMQWTMEDPVHVDSMGQLDALFAAIRRTRIEAARRMPGVYDQEDELE